MNQINQINMDIEFVPTMTLNLLTSLLEAKSEENYPGLISAYLPRKILLNSFEIEAWLESADKREMLLWLSRRATREGVSFILDNGFAEGKYQDSPYKLSLCAHAINSSTVVLPEAESNPIAICRSFYNEWKNCWRPGKDSIIKYMWVLKLPYQMEADDSESTRRFISGIQHQLQNVHYTIHRNSEDVVLDRSNRLVIGIPKLYGSHRPKVCELLGEALKECYWQQPAKVHLLGMTESWDEVQNSVEALLRTNISGIYMDSTWPVYAALKGDIRNLCNKKKSSNETWEELSRRLSLPKELSTVVRILASMQKMNQAMLDCTDMYAIREREK